MRYLLGLALLLASAPTRQPPATVRITVRLVGVQVQKGGVLHVGLHPAPGDGFPGPSPLVNRDVVPIAGPEVTFDALPGEYAVAVHHDANANGRVDTNFFGVPKEGYAVTNDPRPRFRAPLFAEASVVVSRDTTLVVRMVY